MSKRVPDTSIASIFELFVRDKSSLIADSIADWMANNDTFYKFRGQSTDNAIWMKEAPITGTELVVPKMNYSNGTPYFRGTDTTNKGATPSVDSMNVKHSEVKFKGMAYDYQYPIREIGIDIVNGILMNVKEDITKGHIAQVYNQFAKCFAQNVVYYAKKPNAITYKTDEYFLPMYIDDSGVIPFKTTVPQSIPLCGLDEPNISEDVVAFDRCVFGGESMYATVPPANTIAGAIADATFGAEQAVNINNENSAILTIPHLQKMIQLARAGSRVAGNEDVVHPLTTSTFKNAPSIGYVIFISRDAFNGLRQTSEYKNQINRAFREVEGQPSLYNGSEYVMQIGSTDVYVTELLSQMQFVTPTTGTAVGAKINYSVLMGKQAIIHTQSKRLEVQEWETIRNPNQDTFEVIYRETMGYKPVRFSSKLPSKSNVLVDRGLIHSFTLSPQNLL